MVNNLGGYISREEDEKTSRSLDLKFQGTAHIILLNYRTCINNKGMNYYYELYRKRYEENKEIEVSFEDFSKYLDRVISLHCNLLMAKSISRRGEITFEKIDYVYGDIISDASKMGSDKIMNKI